MQHILWCQGMAAVLGQPVYFPAAFKAELLALTGDHGGRTIIRNHPDRVCYVPIDNIRQGVDVDTPEGYEKVKRGRLG